jgi:predicted DNA-binding transcriptional regulator YafY
MSRAERLQLIVSLVRTNPGMRPADLAARCRVSERSIFRDLHALLNLGVPLYFDRGYRLPAPILLPPLFLTGEEALALRVAAGRDPRWEGPLARALERAQSKLALCLSPATPATGAQMPLELPGAPPPAREEARIRSVLEDAVARGASVTLEWARGKRRRPRTIEATARHLSPVERGWVLLADEVGSGRRLTIPVEQIRTVTASAKRGVRPRSEKRGPRVGALAAGLRIAVRLRPPTTALGLDGELPAGVRVERRDGDTVLLASQTPAGRELLGWLLSFGSMIEVLEPPALRAELRRAAADMAALYATETPRDAVER